jgi:hypothetical protein
VRVASTKAGAMTIFEYVMVLVSVVLSLGLARVLETHANLMKAGSRVRWSPTYVLWLAITVAGQIDVWAGLWTLQAAAVWTWSTLVIVLASAAALFYAAVLSSPDLQPDRTLDLWAFHLDNRRRYVGAILAYLLISFLSNVSVLPDGRFETANLVIGLPMLGLLLLAIFVRNRWAQIAAAVLTAGIMTFYFSQYLPQLQG